MNLTTRGERLERSAGLNACPCRVVKQIAWAQVDAADLGATAAAEKPGPGCCELCGRPLAISQIVVVVRPAAGHSDERL